jgi:hypothetical protein
VRTAGSVAFDIFAVGIGSLGPCIKRDLRSIPAADCELLLTEKVGFSTWNAMVLHATATQFSKELVVHFSDSSVAEGLHIGERLRVLQTSLEDGDSGLQIITVRPTTEVFKVVDPGEQIRNA